MIAFPEGEPHGGTDYIQEKGINQICHRTAIPVGMGKKAVAYACAMCVDHNHCKNGQTSQDIEGNKSASLLHKNDKYVDRKTSLRST